jgi:hypothetical protein
MAFVQFKVLKARGIAKSRGRLKTLQQKHGFPLGRLFGDNIRVWDEETEIEPWLESRPTALKTGTPKSPGRPRKANTNPVEA